MVLRYLVFIGTILILFALAVYFWACLWFSLALYFLVIFVLLMNRRGFIRRVVSAVFGGLLLICGMPALSGFEDLVSLGDDDIGDELEYKGPLSDEEVDRLLDELLKARSAEEKLKIAYKLIEHGIIPCTFLYDYDPC